MLRLLLLAQTLLFVSAQAQHLITTLAGRGGSYDTRDGQGEDARFRWPTGVVVDGEGSVFVADRGHTIRKITQEGFVTTLAGQAGVSGSEDGPVDVATFAGPRALALDALGNLFVVEDWSHTVRKITPTGMVTTMAGRAGVSGYQDGVGTNALFNAPRGIICDVDGSVFVSDQGNGYIRKITPDGSVTTLSAIFQAPEGLAFDTQGNLYVGDWVAGHIYRVSVDGTKTAVSFERLVDPTGLAMDSQDNLYVTVTKEHIVQRFAPDGAVGVVAGAKWIAGGVDGLQQAARFNQPRGIAVDVEGRLYVADSANNSVRKITTEGLVTTLAGLGGSYADGAGAVARFHTPGDVATSRSGEVFVADAFNHVIRRIDRDGSVVTVAGKPTWPGSTDGDASESQFNGPQGLTVDGNGTIYVADTSNHVIRKILPSGETSTIAGTAGHSGNSDGTGADATFSLPRAIAVDGSGKLYVTANNAVRKITPDLIVSTFAGDSLRLGNTDGLGALARFSNPEGIAVDQSGTLYVADTQNHTIRTVAPNGLVSTFAGRAGVSGTIDGPVQGGALFSSPTGIAVDTAGNVYVAQMYQEVIRMISIDGIVSTIAGSVYNRGSTDGTGNQATFHSPNAITVDANSDIYIADSLNHTIRKVVRLPYLEIAYPGSGLQLTWPVIEGFLLESCDLPSFSAAWTTISDGIMTNGTRAILTVPSSRSSCFYRLRRP